MDSSTLSHACKMHLARAQRNYPTLDVIDALVADMEATQHALARNSVAVYCHEYRSIITALELDGTNDAAQCSVAAASIHAALVARISDDVPPRTSATKAKSVTAGEIRRIFQAIKIKAVKTNDRTVALVGLMLVALVILGLRPVELTTLEAHGGYLRVQSAKVSTKKPRFRYFDARAVPRDLIQAVLLAAEVYGESQDPAEFAQLHRKISQILARVSVAEIGRRICFYTLRHISIATWKRARISPTDIALLAGHITPATAKHYAGAESGFAGPVIIRPVNSESIPDGLFPDQKLSALIKPPRRPRLRDSHLPLESDFDAPAAHHDHSGAALGQNSAIPAPAHMNTAQEGLDLDSLDIYAAPNSNLNKIVTFAAPPASEALDHGFDLSDMPPPLYKPTATVSSPSDAPKPRPLSEAELEMAEILAMLEEDARPPSVTKTEQRRPIPPADPLGADGHTPAPSWPKPR